MSLVAEPVSGPTTSNGATDTMTRKKIVLSVVAVLALVVLGVAVAGTTPAERGGQFDQVHVQQEDDAEVVATVQGREVTRGEIRKSADYWMAVDSNLTKDTATQKIIVSIIDGHITQAEVVLRGLAPSREETEEFMRPHTEHCMADTPQGEECRQQIKELGFDLDTYWEKAALPEYQKDMGDVKLHQAIFEEMGLGDADSEAKVAALGNIKTSLRANANIVWNDDELGQQYREVLAQEE